MPPTLGSLALEINAMLGNRTDVLTYTTFPTIANMLDTDRLAIWLLEAYNELTFNFEWEELQTAVVDQFIPSIDVYKYPSQMRILRAVTLFFPLGTVPQREPREIRRRHIRNIRRYQTAEQGPPSIYAPFNPGGAAGIIVRPVPDQNYQFIWDIQVTPTFNRSSTNVTNKTVLQNTTSQITDDWLDILKYLTAMKGHAALVEPDKADKLRMLLYGGYDPESGRKIPGMIKERTSLRPQMDIEASEFGLQPTVRRYTNTT